MLVDLETILLLDTIERTGSFSGAAEELHRAPSSITYAVQKCEQSLGFEIFNRSGYKARLIPAGQLLLDEGRHLRRMAEEIADRAKRVTEGWETELRIALDGLVPFSRFFPLVAEFYQLGQITRLRLAAESFGGTWDALISGRADLVLGAAGDLPSTGGFRARLMGTAEFVFAIAPTHPLASTAEPIKREHIQSWRAIAATDSSRQLTPRTAGLLPGQDTLSVPSLDTKLEAHRLGLGVGYLPLRLAQQEQAAGRLVLTHKSAI